MENEILEEIIEYCLLKRIGLIDGIIAYCEDHAVEVETVGALIKKNVEVKDKLYVEAYSLNLVKKEANLISFIVNSDDG